MKKTTAITVHRTSEGERVSVLYSEIDEKGNIIATNQREGFIAMEPDLLGHIEALETYVDSRLNG